MKQFFIPTPQNKKYIYFRHYIMSVILHLLYCILCVILCLLYCILCVILRLIHCILCIILCLIYCILCVILCLIYCIMCVILCLFSFYSSRRCEVSSRAETKRQEKSTEVILYCIVYLMYDEVHSSQFIHV